MPETRDISLRGILAGGFIIAAGIALSLLFSLLLILGLKADPAGPNGVAPPKIAGPVLETAPGADLAAYEREKGTRLKTYGPVEGAPGRLRIPIDRAMRLIAR